MSTDAALAAEAALRQEITETLLAVLAASGISPDDLDDDEQQDLAGLVAALMRVFARHQDPARWTTPLVRDVTSTVLGSLLDGGIPTSRGQVETALAAAGITPGETR